MFVSFERKQRYDYFSVYEKRYSVIFRVPFCFYLRKKWIYVWFYLAWGLNYSQKKLSNEKFVNNAPAAVIEMERKKQADAESIIQSLKESIASLKNV